MEIRKRITTPILDRLLRQNILDIAWDQGKFVLTEACDWYYDATLTREGIVMLAEELLELANAVERPGPDDVCNRLLVEPCIRPKDHNGDCEVSEL